MADCIFCKISKKEIFAEIIFENQKIISFYDINPMSEGHMLIITKKHYDNLSSINYED